MVFNMREWVDPGHCLAAHLDKPEEKELEASVTKQGKVPKEINLSNLPKGFLLSLFF